MYGGNPVLVNVLRVNDKTIIVRGKLFKIASINKEWLEDCEEPESIITALKNSKNRPDVFTFGQRPPETEPKFHYNKEWENTAAIPVSTYDHWWNKQINCKTRNMVRKAGKKGVVIKEVQFNDELVRGIMNVFNEVPVRRGKPNRHYGKDFETVKREMSDSLDRSVFICAYHGDNLIGFIKLLLTDKYAMIVVILSMYKHRDKAPINALLAKSVEVCAQKRILFITYTTWRSGSHGDFQKHNGFEKYPVPRYFVPITLKGKMIIKLKLYHGIKGLIPEAVMHKLLGLRKKWYELKYAQVRT